MPDPALRGPIDVREIITEISVSDLERSRAWYTRLFGKSPDLEPFPGNVEYRLGGGWLQIVKGEVKPSSWQFQIEVRDLAHERERLRAAQVDASEIQGVPNVIRYFNVHDPDGNSLLLFQVLTSDPKVTGGR
jgi:catechol 2,3-dioxygenase-like lactoylglutathione lyase family enzyme